MTNLQAAILKGQIDDIQNIQDKKSNIFDLYKKRLNGVVEFQETEANTKHANWMFGIKINGNVEHLALELYKQGVESRPMFPPISEHKHLCCFSNCNEEAAASQLKNSCLILPSHANLLKGDVEYVCQLIKRNI